ncbi:MAG: ABC transporter permease subunit [Thermoplasmata archaeon]
MSGSRRKAQYLLAKKEFMDKVRNKWVLFIGITFVALILLLSAYGGVQSRNEAGLKGFEFTMKVGSSIVVLLISIVAVIMGYKTVVEEIESRSIALVLASELSREDVILAKFAGLSSVLSVSIFGGLGIGGLIIGITSGFGGAIDYLGFILFSVLFGCAYISIAILMSSFVSSTSRALAGGIFVWIFFNMIWDLVLLGILMATGWSFPTDLSTTITYPDWYWFSGAFNPNSAYGTAISRLTGSTGLPELLNLPLLFCVLMMWIIIPLIIAMYNFDRKDL